MNVESPSRPKEDSPFSGAFRPSLTSTFSNVRRPSTTSRSRPPSSSTLWWPDTKQAVCPQGTRAETSTRATPTRTWCVRARPSRVTRPPSCRCPMRTTATEAWPTHRTWRRSTRTTTTTRRTAPAVRSRAIPSTKRCSTCVARETNRWPSPSGRTWCTTARSTTTRRCTVRPSRSTSATFFTSSRNTTSTGG